MDQTEAVDVLKRVFATLTKKQKANVREHLAKGVKVLVGKVGRCSYKIGDAV